MGVTLATGKSAFLLGSTSATSIFPSFLQSILGIKMVIPTLGLATAQTLEVAALPLVSVCLAGSVVYSLCKRALKTLVK